MKKVEKKIKIQAIGGEATPAPPLGPALGQAGINIGDFVNRFNEATQDIKGEVVPVEIYIYEDRSFDFAIKTPPASKLLMKAAGVSGGSGKNVTKKVGSVSKDQVKEIAERKMPDLNTEDIEQAVKIIGGTAHSMGLKVT